MTRYAALSLAYGTSKQADLQDTMARFGKVVSKGSREAGRSISDWYGAIPEEARAALLRGAGGAAAGGLLAGGMAAATPRDPESGRQVVRPALMGALLGGGAAAALPAGLKMLGGKIRLPGEESSLAGRGLSGLLYPFTANPAVTVGAGLGAIPTVRNAEVVGDAWRLARGANPRLDNMAVPGDLPGKLRHFGSPRNMLEYLRAYTQAGTHVAPSVLSRTGGPKAPLSADLLKLRQSMTRGGRAGLYSIPVGALLGALAGRTLEGQVN